MAPQTQTSQSGVFLPSVAIATAVLLLLFDGSGAGIANMELIGWDVVILQVECLIWSLGAG